MDELATIQAEWEALEDFLRQDDGGEDLYADDPREGLVMVFEEIMGY